MPSIKYSALNWEGLLHSNQDALLVEGEIHQAPCYRKEGTLVTDSMQRVALSDGASGHPSADRASVHLLEYLKKSDAAFPDWSPRTRAAYIADCASAMASRDPAMRNACATLITAEITGHTARIWHVGDSAAFHVTREESRQITTEHIAKNRMIADGTLTASEADQVEGTWLYGGLDQMFIYSGLDDPPVPQVVIQALRPEEVLILATDGLMEHLSEGELKDYFKSGDLAQSREHIREAVARRGGRDNLTLVCVKAVQ